MANVRIDDLAASTTLADTDLFEKENPSVVSNKFTGASLRGALLDPSVISGTAGRVVKFAAASPFLANSIVSESGQVLTLNGGASTLQTATGALTLTPAAGSNLNVSLSTTGDFAVNTNQLYVDTSAGNVGFGTTSPGSLLHVFRNDAVTSAPGLHLEQDGTGDAAVSFELTGIISWAVGVDNSDSDKFKISRNIDLGINPAITINTSNNVGIGTTTFGASAVKSISVGLGTAPSTSPADIFQMYAADIVAGNTAAHFRTETGSIIKLYQQALIADPVGGGTVDAEARTAINAILDLLENNGLMSAT